MKYYLSIIVVLIITFLTFSIFQSTKEDHRYLSYERFEALAATDETRERWKDIMKQDGEDALREYLKSSTGGFLSESIWDGVVEEIKQEVQNEDNTDSSSISNVPLKLDFQSFTIEKIGITLQYPKEWSVGNKGMQFFKGLKEFEISLFKTQGLSLLDSKEFTKMIKEIYSEDSEKELLKPNKINQYEIDGIKTLSFQYLDSYRKVFTVGIIHNDQGYIFKYKTLEDDFDNDKEIMTKIFNSIRFLK